MTLLGLFAAGAVFSASEFANPPAENRPETWFRHIGGNASKSALTYGLESVRPAGIGGAFSFLWWRLPMPRTLLFFKIQMDILEGKE